MSDIDKTIDTLQQKSLQIARMASIDNPKKALSMLKGAITSQSNVLDSLKSRTLEAAVLLGALLAEARHLAPYGKWGDWVEKNCSFTPRHANRLIHLSVYYHGLEPSDRTFMSDLTVTAAIEMARRKADPAKFDAEDFPAIIADPMPDDVDEVEPWRGPEEVQDEPPPVQKEEPKPEPKPAPPPPKPEPKHPETRKSVTIEGECRRIEPAPSPPVAPVVIPSPPAPIEPPAPVPEPIQTARGELVDDRKPLATPKELLKEAARILKCLEAGKKPDRGDVFVWVAAYESLQVHNQLNADRDNDMEV